MNPNEQKPGRNLHNRRETTLSQAAWKDGGYYYYYIYKHLPNPMSTTQLTSYHKITSPESSSIGKFRITFADGSEINHENIVSLDPNFHWPSIPLEANSEDEAKLFSKSWEHYIKSQSKVNLIHSDRWSDKER